MIELAPYVASRKEKLKIKANLAKFTELRKTDDERKVLDSLTGSISSAWFEINFDASVGKTAR